MAKYDIVIIGAGTAGLAAAVEAKKQDVKDVLLVERDGRTGGILNQCLEDYEIPLYLSRTVVQIHGKERLTDVTTAPVTIGQVVCADLPGIGVAVKASKNVDKK